jgi:hypothetical protein
MTGHVQVTEVHPTLERVQEWVKRLRSGNYKQGPGQLTRSDGRNCCWGVACQIGVDNGALVAHKDDFSVVYIWADGDPNHPGSAFITMPPSDFLRWMGIDPEMMITSEVDGITRKVADHFAYRNDKGGWTFSEIADEITEKILNATSTTS